MFTTVNSLTSINIIGLCVLINACYPLNDFIDYQFILCVPKINFCV